MKRPTVKRLQDEISTLKAKVCLQEQVIARLLQAPQAPQVVPMPYPVPHPAPYPPLYSPIWTAPSTAPSTFPFGATTCGTTKVAGFDGFDAKVTAINYPSAAVGLNSPSFVTSGYLSVQ